MDNAPRCGICGKALDGSDPQERKVIVHEMWPQRAGKNLHGGNLIEYEIRYVHLCSLESNGQIKQA